MQQGQPFPADCALDLGQVGASIDENPEGFAVLRVMGFQVADPQPLGGAIHCPSHSYVPIDTNLTAGITLAVYCTTHNQPEMGGITGMSPWRYEGGSQSQTAERGRAAKRRGPR